MIWIRNLDFLRHAIAGELLVIKPCNCYQTISYSIVRQVAYLFRFDILIMDPIFRFYN